MQGYEKFDPEVWLSFCDSGLSPMFTGGVWKWMPVTILGYVDGRYIVEFKSGGKRKAVKRINLVFDREDKVRVAAVLHGTCARVVCESGRRCDVSAVVDVCWCRHRLSSLFPGQLLRASAVRHHLP